ncbi:MAG: UDP-glucose/GDP-mannose dehydrogenase family protein [Acidobacteria bacterium]|nr:UDP-glucose/GDP-mannose dehydrogenase family protein [Acidobacteriota bacterium]
MQITVVGLGKLGAPLAAVLADRGHDVVGVDARPELVDLLNDGRTPIQEPGLAELVARNRPRLRATGDAAAAAAGSDASFIVVPTPSLASGGFSTRFVLDAVAAIGEGLRRTSRYHVVTVTSTVMPLATSLEISPALEAASGRVVGETVGLCYNPEFIALGTVIHDMEHPDLVLIGESDPRAGALVEAIHRSVIAASSQVRRMTWVNAELAKIAVNTFVTTKISYANMLAGLCEQLPGGDVDVVTGAIGIDRRIGHRYLRGAVGYGGPCFPRDNAALATVAAQIGASADIALATDAINRRQVPRIAAIVREHAEPGRDRVGVLGLSYKPDTPVVEESQGVMLAARLAADGFATTVFDPAALGEGGTALGPAIARAASLDDCLDAVDLAVIMVPWPAFREIPARLRARPRRPRTIVDCWRLLDAADLEGLAALVYPGRGATRPRSDRTARGAAGRRDG